MSRGVLSKSVLYTPLLLFYLYNVFDVLEVFVTDLNDAMLRGGLIKVNGINVLFDYDTNLNYYGKPSGYYIVNALSYKVYFKCRDRAKAQATCDMIYGKNRYTVQAKI